MKVALVHDFLTEYGGAERVLEALHEIYPKAPVYTAFFNPDSMGVNAEKFKDWDIRTSWGMRLPFWKRLVSPYRIFCKKFFESFDLSSYDLVISSSNAYLAKAVIVPKGVHICYCHTPPRALYGYPTPINWKKNMLLRPIGEFINHFMRVWDFETSQKVNYFIANSQEVQGRIRKFYRRTSEVIYPPVDVKKYEGKSLKKKEESYFLVVSRLVGSKNVDIVVEVCAALGLPLKIVGRGKDEAKLREMAGEGSVVEFVGDVDDEKLIELYKGCRAVIFPASQEDFGLVPVEAMAAGKPVIANAEGGVLETVVDKKTGVYFDPPTAGSLTLAINNFIAMEKKGVFDARAIKKHAQKFSKERFKLQILDFVKKVV